MPHPLPGPFSAKVVDAVCAGLGPVPSREIYAVLVGERWVLGLGPVPSREIYAILVGKRWVLPSSRSMLSSWGRWWMLGFSPILFLGFCPVRRGKEWLPGGLCLMLFPKPQLVLLEYWAWDSCSF